MDSFNPEVAEYPGQPAPSPEGQLSRQQQRLDEATAELHGMIDQLTQRLEPILRPESDELEKLPGSPPEEVLVLVASAVGHSATVTTIAATRLRSLIERIEL